MNLHPPFRKARLSEAIEFLCKYWRFGDALSDHRIGLSQAQADAVEAKRQAKFERRQARDQRILAEIAGAAK